MKKFMACLAILVAAVLSLCACQFLELLPTQPSGAEYPSDVATSHGEDGSPESYLSSFDMPTSELRRAYEEAREDGSFTGTYFEFLTALPAGDDSAAVQRGLLSIVSVYATFTGTGRFGNEFQVIGSGVIYDLDTEEGDAYVITNYHVIYSGSSNGRETVAHISDAITLYLYGGEAENGAIRASFVGGAMKYDIAVLRVEDSPVLKETTSHPVYAREAVAVDSDSLVAGERVYALGNADAQGISVTSGTVSVPLEYIDVQSSDERGTIEVPEIRIDAAVNHGNSGGGLFTASGELAGIVNARDEEEGILGFGYAIPANLALALVQNIIDNSGGTTRGAVIARMGVTVAEGDSRGIYDEELGKIFIEKKVYVTGVEDGSPAKEGGIAADDTFVTLTLHSTRGGEAYTRTVAVTNLFRLTTLLVEVRMGDTIDATMQGSGGVRTVRLNFSDTGDFTLAS